MPTDAARDIVNALFAGQKDLSDYVAKGMNDAAVAAIDTMKQEVGAQMFKEPEENPPEEEAPAASAEEETPTEEEEPTNETDQGGD